MKNIKTKKIEIAKIYVSHSKPRKIEYFLIIYDDTESMH